MRILSEGGFGRVYAGERRSDSKPVAIKHIPKKFVQVNCQGIVYDEILDVVLMDQAASHLCGGSFENRAVIGLMDTFELEKEVLIVMERQLESVDMFDFLKVKLIPEGQAKVVFKQIVNTTLLMHRNGINAGLLFLADTGARRIN
uniref:non-specific serine/threonine protein kinase n=1 Tax=Gouania willdenowi TaxID=441366 RepID=A0A8C5DN68_GOUWI